MTSDLDRIRDQQRLTWDQFSTGWKTWDAKVIGWLGPVGDVMIDQAHVRDDSEVLDVATGTGEPGLTAAALVPHGRVTLTDLAERMLEVASANAVQRGLYNVAAQVCDAGALPFADASFDAVLCRFGFMFFPDVDATAAEFVRVARPGARVSAAVWGPAEVNPWATTIMGTIARHVAMPTPEPGAPGLFRCAGDGYLRQVFTASGLRDITEHQVIRDVVFDSAVQYWDFMTDVAAPVVAGLAQADHTMRETIHTEVVDQVHQQAHGGRVHLRSTATVVAGTR